MNVKNLLFFVLLLICFDCDAQKQIKHYIFFSTDREKIHESKFYLHQGLEGAQITYHWRTLEPEKDHYDFSSIEEDLKFLSGKGKKLWVQLQDVTFVPNRYACPKYLLQDPQFHGGANAQYEITPEGRLAHGGNVTRRWDPAVAKRFHLLISKLAEKFDGRIAGINLPETAVDFPDTLGVRPVGFSTENYLEAIKTNMKVLRMNFKKSIPMQYANFMPGDSRKELEEVFRYGTTHGIAMGGPDVKVYRKFQMKNSYPLIRESSTKVPTGVAIQEGNYSIINDSTKNKVTVPEILDFGKNYLLLSYMFWCTEEPFYSTQVLPMLNTRR